MPMSADTQGGQWHQSDPPELQVVVSHLIRVLETELRASPRADNIVNC